MYMPGRFDSVGYMIKFMSFNYHSARPRRCQQSHKQSVRIQAGPLVMGRCSVLQTERVYSQESRDMSSQETAMHKVRVTVVSSAGL